jgi:hypothetical protein
VRQTVRALGNVTLLERPVRVAALMTAVQTALRARQRQYNAREHLRSSTTIATALARQRGAPEGAVRQRRRGHRELTADGPLRAGERSLCRLLGERRELVLSRSCDDRHGDDRAELEALERLSDGHNRDLRRRTALRAAATRTIWCEDSRSRSRSLRGRARSQPLGPP